MKRSFKLLCALFLLISLSSLLAVALAQSDPHSLTISEIAVHPEEQGVRLNITLQNNGDADIDEFGIALAFFDDDDYRLYGYDNTLDGYKEEVCNWYYTPEEPILPGETYLTEDVFSNYGGAATVAVAVRYYHKTDQYYILLPESNWNWTAPGYEAADSGAGSAYYVDPPNGVYDVIGDVSLGYSYYLLDDFNAAYYGKNQGGEWISKISPGSPAMEAGLQVGDLVLFIDGVKPTENEYAVEYGMAAILGGEKVEWVYERDGVIYTTRVSLP